MTFFNIDYLPFILINAPLGSETPAVHQQNNMNKEILHLFCVEEDSSLLKLWKQNDDIIVLPCHALQVRYHSRKRLAEQRPRVRGQFVRQAWHEDKSNEDKDC